MIDKLKRLICDWFHAGGRVKRDPQGRINWQCDTCGRFSPYFGGDNMNVLDKRTMLEGLCYMFSASRYITEDEMDALIAARDIMKKAGLLASANSLGGITVKNRDGKQVATGLFF